VSRRLILVLYSTHFYTLRNMCKEIIKYISDASNFYVIVQVYVMHVIRIYVCKLYVGVILKAKFCFEFNF